MPDSVRREEPLLKESNLKPKDDDPSQPKGRGPAIEHATRSTNLPTNFQLQPNPRPTISRSPLIPQGGAPLYPAPNPPYRLYPGPYSVVGTARPLSPRPPAPPAFELNTQPARPSPPVAAYSRGPIQSIPNPAPAESQAPKSLPGQYQFHQLIGSFPSSASNSLNIGGRTTSSQSSVFHQSQPPVAPAVTQSNPLSSGLPQPNLAPLPASFTFAPPFSGTRKKLPTKSNTIHAGKMAGKKSQKSLLREEGLERTDNGMKQTSWPEVSMINQKNYYTEFMKHDEQILVYRLQNEANRDRMIRDAKDRDRALARTGETDVPLPPNGEAELEDDEAGANDGIDPSKILVVHPGSQNLRIGLASDALPKSIPMVIATQAAITESDKFEPRPKRQKIDGTPDQQFGEEFSKKFTKMSNDLKVDMRANKRKVLPNSKDMVVNFNRRTEPEKIPEHNDPMRIEWTDASKFTSDRMNYFSGMEALRIPDDSDPKFRLYWPIQQGWFNEDYQSTDHLLSDFESVIEWAMRIEVGLNNSAEWDQYSCVFVIPDLYDKRYVEHVLKICLENFEFKQVCFIQESLAASYGAGYTIACIVDVGAQKTSIACVEEGMVIENSRVNLKFGGYDVTETFIKMLLHDHFPYDDINLKRRYDFLLAEELKINCCTLNQADVSVRNPNFHLRVPNQATRKYHFKTYDEVILAPMGFFDPSLFENNDKLATRRKLLNRSYNAYDVDIPDDPTSDAQTAILTTIKPSLATTTNGLNGSNGNGNVATPSKEKSNPLSFLSRLDSEANGVSQVTSAAGSPAPEGANTPVPSGPFVFGANGTNSGTPPPSAFQFQFGGSHNSGTPAPQVGMLGDQLARTQKDLAIERDSILPISPLDTAIITSITHAAKGDEKKMRDFFGGIMVVGGGAKTPGFGPFLEEKLKARRPDIAEKILVGASPREMDGQVVVWKGASVFSRMKTHESWIGGLEFDRLGSRALHHKVLWNY